MLCCELCGISWLSPLCHGGICWQCWVSEPQRVKSLSSNLTTESHIKYFMYCKPLAFSFIHGFSLIVIFFFRHAFILRAKTPQIPLSLLLINALGGEGMQSELSGRFWGCNHGQARSFPRGEVLHNASTALLLHQESPGFPLEVN